MKFSIPLLLQRFCDPEVARSNVITWSSPVPSFGDLSKSRVATLGLNPSNREFVDQRGNELTGASRRFHTLQSLKLASWSCANSLHHEKIAESCESYFGRNPYDGWFRQLDFIISGTKTSYYDTSSRACHLDLIPFATSCKWTDLQGGEKKMLLNSSSDILADLLKNSPVRLLILNGRSVVNQFEEVAQCTLTKQNQLDWALRRGGKATIQGFSYEGVISQVAGIELNRKLLVLGFNHNIQSSFGVTNTVRAAIRQWISKAASKFGL